MLRDARARAARRDRRRRRPSLAKDIGYELRCAKPVPFDVEYTRTLGYGAVRYLLDGGSGALIALSGGRVVPVALDELLDPATGRIRMRLVDVTTEAYASRATTWSASSRSDFAGTAKLDALAAQTNLDPETFRAQFDYVARA